MSKKRDQRNILIGVLLVAIVVMSVGYAAFATTLTVGGTSTITNNWNVAITDITVTDTQGNAKSTTATYTATTATFAVDLQSPGDRIEYTVTVRNGGTVDATLEQLVPVITGETAAISYTIDGPTAGSILKSGEEVTLKISAEYDASFTGTVSTDANSKTLTVTLDYVQKN
jgi:conserved repeat protein